jgi:hypothetical protein
VSAWIKTSASDCHFDELVDGTQSQTVAIGSSDEWKQYIINGTTGTTSYGWRVRCDTAITDDVFVDETFAGAAEPNTFDIGTASLWGSVKWDTTTDCLMQVSATSFTNYGADADCDDNARTIKGTYNSTNGDVGNPDGQKPQIKFSYIPSGILRCELKGFLANSAANQYAHRFTDGTNNTSNVQFYNQGTGDVSSGPIVIGEFNYTTPQTSETTIQLQSQQPSGTSSIHVNTDSEELEISCYHYPAPQKVVAAKCDGLECENEFSAKIDSAANIYDESVDWLTTASFSYPTFTVNFQAGLFNSTPNCQVTPGPGYTGNVFAMINTVSTSSISIATDQDAGTPSNFSFILHCQRQGSDYKQFDTRFIPVTDNKEEIFNIYYQTNMWDAATATDEFDHSLAVPSFSTSDYITVTDVSGQTRITNVYDRNINIDICITSAIDANGNVQIYDSSGNSHQAESNKMGTDTANSVCALMSLSPSDYIYVYSSDPVSTRNGSLNMTVRPADQKAFIGNLTPKEFVQTPGSTKPVIYSAFVTDGAGTTTVSKEYSDWITGNCTNPSTGNYVCTIDSGRFSAAPNCVANNDDGNNNSKCNTHTETTTSVSVTCRLVGGATDSQIDQNFKLMCHGVK